MGVVNKVLNGVEALGFFVIISTFLGLFGAFCSGALVGHLVEHVGVKYGFLYSAAYAMVALVYYIRASRRNWKVSNFVARMVFLGCWGCVLGLICMVFPVFLARSPSQMDAFYVVVACSIATPLLSYLPWQYLPVPDFFD